MRFQQFSYFSNSFFYHLSSSTSGFSRFWVPCLVPCAISCALLVLVAARLWTANVSNLHQRCVWKQLLVVSVMHIMEIHWDLYKKCIPGWRPFWHSNNSHSSRTTRHRRIDSHGGVRRRPRRDFKITPRQYRNMFKYFWKLLITIKKMPRIKFWWD